MDFAAFSNLYGLNSIYIGFGVVVLLNLPLVVYLSHHVNQRKKEIILIMALSISDLLSGAQFLLMGLVRYFFYSPEAIVMVPKFICATSFISSSYIILLQMDNLFSLIIALDRLFAILLPVKYQQLEIKSTIFLIILPFLGSLIGWMFHAILVLHQPPTWISDICFNKEKIGVKLSKGMRNLTRTVAYTTLASVFLVLIPEICYSFFEMSKKTRMSKFVKNVRFGPRRPIGTIFTIPIPNNPRNSQ
ncbi:unnamed protein product [Caenorhabditis bovis]|uniref:G-protein coupled receptors family 1 profile domain-containing protein n=1 Tax=Caenorhabditis bovis TaxID=2654633 RepID=A0A8S1F080_9PELO|nr:unnamed protein product [Caenorhabditis bovis]